MSATLTPALDYSTPATREQVQQTADAVRARGFKVEIVETAAEALKIINALIPEGATLMTGASKTLQEIGLEAQLMNKEHAWVNLKDEILAETDPAKQKALRLQSTLAPYYVGSVQAIAQTGELVFVSASGSQLPAYTHTSPNVIWVAGVQKIVPDLNEALRRIREYAFPIESERMKGFGYPGSVLAKILIMEQEPAAMQRNVTLILVNEVVGV